MTKPAVFYFAEAMADMGFRQNNGLACYDCGVELRGLDDMRGLHIVGKPAICSECYCDRIEKKAKAHKSLPVGPAA